MNPIRVLLVDDSPVFLSSASEFVQETAGLQLVGVATSGAEALRVFEQTTPELVLMDLNMPGMNGIEATRRIKSIGLETKVIVISVQMAAELQSDLHMAGADAFVLKDELLDGVLSHVRQWFNPELFSTLLRPDLRKPGTRGY